MKVKFVPQNIELEIAPGQSVKDLADKNNIFIKSICNGLPSCAECRVKIVDGEHNVTPPALKEINLIGSGYFIDQRRLSCQLLCFGDLTVDMTEQLEKQKSVGAKRPQGSKKTEAEATSAVTGNFLEQEKDVLKIAEESLREAPPQQQRQQQNQRGQQQNQQRGQPQQRNQQQNQRGQQQNLQRGNQQQNQRGQQSRGQNRGRNQR